MNIDDLIKKLKKQLRHAKKRRSEIPFSVDDEGITAHGGWDLGYYDGKILTIESTLDELDEDWENS